MSRAAEGWYPDPTGRHEYRWWTGRTWAEAVADDGVQRYDADGLTPGAPEIPHASPNDPDHAAVVASCGAGAVPGDEPMTAPVLTIWRRRSGPIDLHPTWSVHDGVGRWLGTFGLEVAGPTPDDRRFVLRRPDGTSITVAPHPPDVARLTDGVGRVLASITTERDAQRFVAVVDGMSVAHATFAVGEVPVHDAAGSPVGRIVPPPIKVRRAVGRRVGWDPVLLSEQLAPADPITGRGVNALGLTWEHALRERVGP